MAGIALQGLLVGCLACAVAAQARGPHIDFLNERLKIPESQLFVESDYIESGVGLGFGIDKRLSYFPGQYQEAVQAFAESIQKYRYKADIWVFLARSYFYMREPQRAKDILLQAAATMPDLSERLWDPLLKSMLGEIRKRADNLQNQVDFYTKSQDDYHNLFRLYKFLQDHVSSIGVIHAAGAKAVWMRLGADMASAEKQRAYRAEASKWDSLALVMTGELEMMGVSVPPRPVHELEVLALTEAGHDRQLIDDTQVLQMRVDYYESDPADFRQLFDNYLVLDMADRAHRVIAALDREILRVRFLADAATDFVQASQYLEEVSGLESIREKLKAKMDASGAAP